MDRQRLNLFCWIVTFWLSDLEDILEGTVWFILGVYSTVSDRDFIQGEKFDVTGQLTMPSNEWDKLKSFRFGQLVPLFLLSLPLLSFVESWRGESRNQNTTKDVTYL